MHFSERSQRAVVWWAIAFTVIYGVALGLLLHMIPPPHPRLNSAQIQDFYTRHHDSVRVGAVICSWCSAFMLPLWCVISIQIRRQETHEDAKPIWTYVALTGGSIMAMFLVLPPLIWGAAAYTPGRSADATAALHDLGMLTLTTTDQFYIFAWVAVVVMCFRPNKAPNSPFPRWFGYFSIWIATMFEAGAFAFLPRTGPLAWNGLLVFWSPLSLFGLWITVMCVLLLRSLKAQTAAAAPEPAEGRPLATPTGNPAASPAAPQAE